MVPFIKDSGPIAGRLPGTSSKAGIARQPSGIRKTGTPMDLERWTLLGACGPDDMHLFFGRDGERITVRETREAKAKAVCAACPVRGRCLEFALETDQKFGIYGGLNEDERAKLQKQARR